MRKTILIATVLVIGIVVLRSNLTLLNKQEPLPQQQLSSPAQREISGQVKRGETLFDIFKKYNLSLAELFKMREASASVHRLRDLKTDRPYSIIVDDNDKINAFRYWIDDDHILHIRQTESGFAAVKTAIPYEQKLLRIDGGITDSLIASLDTTPDGLLLALQLSDIFAWDIDFNTDLRKNDTYSILVEGLYLDGQFKKFGRILSAAFTNDGDTFNAYRYEYEGRTDYFDEKGASLRKAFLKAPLSFRRISSTFSKGRYHPILKIRRPHNGLDYSAPSGTPVSAAGDGTVVFAGRKGQYGKLVILRHRNGYRTYYGHLSGFARRVRGGVKVEQGDVIGYVGATGLATGPHLHYEMRLNERPVNPLSQKIPKGIEIPKSAMASFRAEMARLDGLLASIRPEGQLTQQAARQ